MEAQAAQLDAAKMTKVQKLAALLIMLGPESASQIMKHLEPRELESVSQEMSRLPVIPQDLQQDILCEFADVAVEASTSVLGGVKFARNSLEKSVGLFRASDIIGRVAPEPVSFASMQHIVDMDSRQLFNLLKNEQPQTIALVASYLPPAKSSQLLTLLHGDLRDDVVERLATLGPTPVDVVERIVNVLSRKSGGAAPTHVMSQTGGLKPAADLLNSLEHNLSQSVLAELDKRNPDLSQAIRNKMFTFEDMVRLDKSSLQKIMREVDMRELAMALKTASDTLKQKLLSSVSKRAAETVREEISFLGPLKKKEIEAAQMRIIESVRALEAEGEVDLGSVTGKPSDEVLV